MLDVLKDRLPDGLRIVKVKGCVRRRQIRVLFDYDGTKIWGYLPKSCAPGYDEHVCDMTICSAMMKIGFERKDLDMVKLWNDKLNGLCEQS